MFFVILAFLMFGLPAGFLMLIVELLINYTRNKEARAKLENLIPKRDTSRDVSFPDLQNSIGGKRQDGTPVNGEQKQYKYDYTYTSNGTRVSTGESTDAKKSTAEQKSWKVNKAEPYARPVRKRSIGKTIASASLFAVSGVTFFTVLTNFFEIVGQHGFEQAGEFAGLVPMLLLSIACLIAGLWIVLSSQKKRDKENRYIAIINQGYGMIPIDNISYLFPKKYDECVNDLQEMINNGTLQGAYIDYGRRLLVLDPMNSSIEPLINKEAAEQNQAEQNKRTPVKKSSASKKIDFLSLERLSKTVKDEDIKLKLIRISRTLKTIGQKAEENPEIKKAAGVDTFMEMYIPKTISLVEQYEQVNQEADLPENNELKENILETLDAIDNAAMTLWKDIIHSDMIDISSELDALQAKLMMDGYSESDFHQTEAGRTADPDKFDFSNMDVSKAEVKGEVASPVNGETTQADVGAAAEELPSPNAEDDVFAKLRKEQEKEKEQVH